MSRHYKIGEFAKNLGVSAGFLKHHEKYGLLKPKVAESGYRYYEFHQAMLVVQCIRLQNMGFTSKEISEILDHTVSADMRQVFEEKREKILQKYHLYREMLCYMDHLSGKGESEAEKIKGGEWCVLRPEPFYYVEMKNGMRQLCGGMSICQWWRLAPGLRGWTVSRDCHLWGSGIWGCGY